MGQNMGQIVRQQNFQRSPNLISICVDEIRNGELSGRLYHCYSEEACPFSNVAHLIELAENLFDQIKFPQASTQMRTFTDKSRKTVQPPEKKKSEGARQKGDDVAVRAVSSAVNLAGHGQMGRRRSRVEILQ